MNRILIVCIFAFLPDTNEGFVAPQLKVALSRHRFLTSSCVLLGNDIGISRKDKILSALISVGSTRRSFKNVIQKLFRYDARTCELQSDRGASQHKIEIDVKNLEIPPPNSRSKIDAVNNSITKMKAKVLTEKIRLLPAFVLVNILSFWKFIRPCIASGECCAPVYVISFEAEGR